FESPEYILSTMTDAVLDTWTEQSRLECLLHCLESWAAVPDQDVGRKEWLLERCADLRETAAGSPEKLDIYAPVMWNTLKAANFGNSRLLELCQKNETHVLSRMIVAAFIYEVELRALAATPPGPLSSVVEHLGLLFTVLEQIPALHAALYRAQTFECWAIIETTLALRASQPRDEASTSVPDPCLH
ncbi:hypothetical protein PHYSODRAFT_497993, partial [Phytophthora sojae]